MGARYREVGGGPATGVADSWANTLQSMMGGGSTPSTQMNNAPNAMARIMQEILSPGAGAIGGNFASQIERGIGRERGALTSRFSSMNGGYGSGAGQALAQFGAEVADRVPMDIANLQMGTIQQLMQAIGQFSQRGVSQRSTVAEPNPWLQGLQAFGDVAKTVGPMIAGAPPMPSGSNTSPGSSTSGIVSPLGVNDTSPMMSGYSGFSGGRGGVPYFNLPRLNSQNATAFYMGGGRN
jgi:hypothetical protein